METTDINKPTQFPEYWDEEWLQIAIDELDRRKLTHDERASLEILIARNAEAVKAVSRKIAEAKKEGREEEKLAVKTEMVTNALNLGLTVEQCVSIISVSEDFVLNIQRQLTAN